MKICPLTLPYKNRNMKELKIEVPKGYEIDKENSTFECIKFKKKQEIKTYNDLRRSGLITRGWYVDEKGNIDQNIGLDVLYEGTMFATEKEAKSARAAAMISQLMPYYGGAITDEEWSNADISKYIITRIGDTIVTDFCLRQHHLLSFRTEEYRDEFLENNEQLVKDFFMID